jgi:hypothetical protein
MNPHPPQPVPPDLAEFMPDLEGQASRAMAQWSPVVHRHSLKHRHKDGGPVSGPATGTPYHIEIWVPDLHQAIRSWGLLPQQLGYTAYQSWPAGRSWRLGPTYNSNSSRAPKSAEV